MSQGVLSLFGQTSSSSQNLINSITDKLEVPFLSLSDQSVSGKTSGYRYFMQPDVTPLVASLIKQRNLKNVYFIYNNDDGKFNIL